MGGGTPQPGGASGTDDGGAQDDVADAASGADAMAGPDTPEDSGAEQTDPDCTAVSDAELVCDGVDDDCNGIVDDVDLGGDGFCDCYSIGIVGTAGANPASDFDAWLNATGTGVTRFGTDPGHVLTAEEIAPFDILILDRLTHVYTDAEAAVLRAFVEQGHGLITMAGYDNSATDRAQQNSLVRAVGVQLVEPIYLDPTEEWLEHPISDGTSDVQFRGGWPLEALPGETLGQTVLRSQDDSAILGVAKEAGSGRAFIYGDEWISFDSEWRTIPGVTVLWQNAIRWVGPTTACFPTIQ